ncbi:hypothetical protein [Trichloromonas sp.]|uniref:hypothetical protein n=1 Tax=Trichloromonas sp. TaxID=3069249 RepID=UPI003D8170D6
MKNRLIVTLATVLTLSLPLGAIAMDHKAHDHGSHAGMEHKSMEGMEHDQMKHGGMAMSGNMIMLGEQEVEGVEAMVHLKDVKENMAKMGMPQTHHFMVMFVDTNTGESVEQGIAAVKIVDPAGAESEAVGLMGMQGHFGADVALSAPGEYVFKLGTKLADGKKRQYEFKYIQN